MGILGLSPQPLALVSAASWLEGRGGAGELEAEAAIKGAQFPLALSPLSPVRALSLSLAGRLLSLEMSSSILEEGAAGPGCLERSTLRPSLLECAQRPGTAAPPASLQL